MSNLYQFPEGQIIAFALIFLRMVAFVVTWPIFGTASVPIPVKVLLSLILAMTLFPLAHFQNVDQIGFSDQLLVFSIRELFIGVFLGFLMRFFFFAFAVAGEIASVSMGLASAQIYNPAMGTSSNVVEQFQVILASLFFLAMNGHHLFLTGLAQSLEIVPVGAVGVQHQAFLAIASTVEIIFIIGIKISAPVMVAIFVTNIAMGILGRAVPQINVLVTSMPVTISVGILVMMVSMPLLMGEMEGLVTLMSAEFMKAMRGL